MPCQESEGGEGFVAPVGGTGGAGGDDRDRGVGTQRGRARHRQCSAKSRQLRAINLQENFALGELVQKSLLHGSCVDVLVYRQASFRVQTGAFSLTWGCSAPLDNTWICSCS